MSGPKKKKAYAGAESGPGSGLDFDAELERIRKGGDFHKLYEEIEREARRTSESGDKSEIQDALNALHKLSDVLEQRLKRAKRRVS